MASNEQSLPSNQSATAQIPVTTDPHAVRRSKRRKGDGDRPVASNEEDIHTLVTSIFPCFYMAVGVSDAKIKQTSYHVYLLQPTSGHATFFIKAIPSSS
jgi:hypothetical protein